MILYCRVTVRLPESKRTFWAKKIRETERHRAYRVIDVEGEEKNEIVFADVADVVVERPARMNLFYGSLEMA